MGSFVIGCWLGGAAVVAAGASLKGYSALGFFALSLFASPVVTFAALCFAPKRLAPAGRRPPLEGPYKYCGRCENKVLLTATVCLHCGAGLTRIVRLPPPKLLAAPAPRLQATGWQNIDS